jgi:hypothetical protein
VVTFADLYPNLRKGELLTGTKDARFAHAWDMADEESFTPRAI